MLQLTRYLSVHVALPHAMYHTSFYLYAATDLTGSDLATKLLRKVL